MKTLKIIAAGALIALVVVALVGCGGGTSSVNMRSGKVYFYQNKDYVKAEELFRKAIAEEPTNWEAYYFLGLSLTQQAKFKDAGEAFDKAHDLAPADKKTQVVDTQKQYFSDHFKAGRSAMQSNNLKEAIAEFENAVGVYPHDASAYVNLAFVHRQLGETDDALNAAKKAVSIDSTSIYAWSNLAAIYQGAKDDKAAAEALQKVVDLKPTEKEVLSGALYSLGNIHYDAKEYQKALEYYDKAAEIKADDPWLQYQIGVSHLLLEKYPEALPALQKCADLTKSSTREDEKGLYQDAMYNLGICYIQMQDYDKAIFTLESLLTVQENVEIHEALGRAYSKKGMKDRAIDELKKADVLRNK
ncbi:MAG TPA: tetratricopeptide repeat protein [bacterium]|nr:tetratricopeptide repeat protein [bacterium]